MELDELASLLGSGLNSRVIHLGSCQTLYTDKRNLQRFLRDTGAAAVTGFKRSIDWLESATFEVLYFDVLLRYSLTPTGVRAAERHLRREHNAVCKRLEFRVVTRA
jgi:hypothetical protein